jgi:hypothetical protein
MPIAHVSAAAGTAHRDIVKELANACINYFSGIRGPGNGIGNGSCCATVKLTALEFGLPAYRYGQSQAHNLDPDAINTGGVFDPQQHAERQAHAAGILAGGYLPHIFVELPPCGGHNGCAAWCGNTVAVANVWYLYPSTAAMTIAHAGGTAAEFGALNTALP